MECLDSIWSSNVCLRSKALKGYKRGNDWHIQQGLLHQIKAIEFQSVNTARSFVSALR